MRLANLIISGDEGEVMGARGCYDQSVERIPMWKRHADRVECDCGVDSVNHKPLAERVQATVRVGRETYATSLLQHRDLEE